MSRGQHTGDEMVNMGVVNETQPGIGTDSLKYVRALLGPV